MRHPEQAGFVTWVVAQEGKGTVVVTAPHAEAVAVGIKGHQWCEDQIKRPDRNGRKGFYWRFENAEAIGSEAGFRCVGKEPQAVAIESVQYGQEDLFAALPSPFDQRCGVLFAIVGQKRGNALCAAKPGMTTEVMRKQLGMRVALAFAQGASLMSNVTTKRDEVRCGVARGHVWKKVAPPACAVRARRP